MDFERRGRQNSGGRLRAAGLSGPRLQYTPELRTTGIRPTTGALREADEAGVIG